MALSLEQISNSRKQRRILRSVVVWEVSIYEYIDALERIEHAKSIPDRNNQLYGST